MRPSLIVAGLCAGLWLTVPCLTVAQDASKIIAMENLWNRAELNKMRRPYDFCWRTISS